VFYGWIAPNRNFCATKEIIVIGLSYKQAHYKQVNTVAIAPKFTLSTFKGSNPQTGQILETYCEYKK